MLCMGRRQHTPSLQLLVWRACCRLAGSWLGRVLLLVQAILFLAATTVVTSPRRGTLGGSLVVAGFGFACFFMGLAEARLVLRQERLGRSAPDHRLRSDLFCIGGVLFVLAGSFGGLRLAVS